MVLLLFEMMFDPSFLFKMTTTTVDDLVLVLVIVVAVEVTCDPSFLRKTPLNASLVCN